MLIKEPEQMELLRDMGISYCFFGIETYTHAAGKAIGKGMDPERIKEMLHRAKECWGENVIMSQGMIFGLPHQNEQDMHDDMAWIMSDDSPIDFAEVQPLFISSPRMRAEANYVYLSKFDMEYEKWGYRFPHNSMEKSYSWVKEDDTDISSYEEVKELAEFYNQALWPRLMKSENRKKINMWSSAIDHPAYEDFNKLKRMTKQEQDELINSLPDFTGQHTDGAVGFGLLLEKSYIKPLLEKHGVVFKR